MPYDSDKLAQAIMAQARAQATPVKKNWGNPGPLFVIPHAAVLEIR